MTLRKEKRRRPDRRKVVPPARFMDKPEWDDDDSTELIGPGDPEPHAGGATLS
jgi:hypothetical protein